jgi:hypothetical protein
MKNWLPYVVGIALGAFIMTVAAVIVKDPRQSKPSPIVAYARRVIMEFPDGKVRIIKLELRADKSVTWVEDEPNPYRAIAAQAQDRKRREREAALRKLPKVKLTETNSNETQ